MITNTKKGNGGGTTNPFPSEQIVLSGEDLSSKGYRDLDNDLTLTKAEAPKLWSIYNTSGADQFLIKANTNHNTDKKWWIKIE